MKLINSTIGEMLAERARCTPDHIGLRFNGQQYTWKQIDNIAKKLHMELQESGLKRGDCVGILGSNSAGWVLYYFALMKLGAVAVLFSTRSKEVEIERGVRAANVKGLIYSDGYKSGSYDLILDHFQHMDVPVKSYIPMERPATDWKVAAATGSKIDWTEGGSSSDVASILFTSGTTSSSKGVQLTHFNLLNNARATVENMHWDVEDIMCVSVPLFHCFGVTTCILSAMTAGAQLVILSNFRTLEICKCIEEHRCTVLNGVPSMFLAMLRNQERVNFDLCSLKSGIIAGSPIFSDEYIEVCSMFDGIRLQPSYGQTETSPCITIADFNDTVECKSKNAGKVIEHVEARICCLKDGKICEHGEKGEIQVRGYNVMKGYVGNPEETSRTFTEDGWLKTGDMGYLSENGYLTITGRCKNLIVRGGENISPVEIENCIKQVVKNCDVKVFGIPSVVLQEEIVACIESKEKASLRKGIEDYLEENLSDYKIPKFIFFLEEMPRGSTGKIDEKKLKNDVLTIIDNEKLNQRG